MSPIDAYMKNSVETATPLQQVILLYDRAIIALKAAKDDIRHKDIQSKVSNLTRVSDIIRALDSSLDFEKGGEIAHNLHLLYDFVLSQLPLVHARNDEKLLEDLVDILQNLKEGWEGIGSKI